MTHIRIVLQSPLLQFLNSWRETYEHVGMGDPTYTIFAEFVPPFVKDGVGYVFPDDHQKKPLGSGEEVRDIITSYFPDIKWSGPSYGDDSYEGQVLFYYEQDDGEQDYGWSSFVFAAGRAMKSTSSAITNTLISS